MNKIHIKDGIRIGDIEYIINDKVILARRKKNGHPRSIEDGVLYTLESIENECLIVKEKAKNSGFMQPIKVHRSYMVPIRYLRDDIIQKLLD